MNIRYGNTRIHILRNWSSRRRRCGTAETVSHCLRPWLRKRQALRLYGGAVRRRQARGTAAQGACFSIDTFGVFMQKSNKSVTSAINRIGVVSPPNSSKSVRGLGDVVAKVTSAVGMSPCQSCMRRQETLNRMIPFTR